MCTPPDLAPANAGLSAAASSIKLLILAEVRLYREGLSRSLASREGLTVTGAAASLQEALAVAAQHTPDVIIVDMATRDGLSAVRRLREAMPAILLVGFGVDEVAGEILACAEAGLAGYVPCDASLDDLVMRIESVSRGELLCTPKIAASLFRRLEATRVAVPAVTVAPALTARERDVLVLIENGLSNKEIASRLHIEVSTVKNHVHHLLEKLNVTSRAQAAAQLGTHLVTREHRRRVLARGTTLVS